jgi:hypothetical protein
MLLKDLAWDENGSTGVELPDGKWLDLFAQFNPQNPIESRFSLFVYSPPTGMDSKMLVWAHETGLHPLEAQALLHKLTTEGFNDALQGDRVAEV